MAETTSFSSHDPEVLRHPRSGWLLGFGLCGVCAILVAAAAAWSASQAALSQSAWPASWPSLVPPRLAAAGGLALVTLGALGLLFVTLARRVSTWAVYPGVAVVTSLFNPASRRVFLPAELRLLAGDERRFLLAPRSTPEWRAWLLPFAVSFPSEAARERFDAWLNSSEEAAELQPSRRWRLRGQVALVLALCLAPPLVAHARFRPRAQVPAFGALSEVEDTSVAFRRELGLLAGATAAILLLGLWLGAPARVVATRRHLVVGGAAFSRLGLSSLSLARDHVEVRGRGWRFGRGECSRAQRTRAFARNPRLEEWRATLAGLGWSTQPSQALRGWLRLGLRALGLLLLIAMHVQVWRDLPFLEARELRDDFGQQAHLILRTSDQQPLVLVVSEGAVDSLRFARYALRLESPDWPELLTGGPGRYRLVLEDGLPRERVAETSLVILRPRWLKEDLRLATPWPKELVAAFPAQASVTGLPHPSTVPERLAGLGAPPSPLRNYLEGRTSYRRYQVEGPRLRSEWLVSSEEVRWVLLTPRGGLPLSESYLRPRSVFSLRQLAVRWWRAGDFLELEHELDFESFLAATAEVASGALVEDAFEGLVPDEVWEDPSIR